MTSATPRRLLLVGFMGAGKTSVGRRLAETLGWRFIDFDEVIEAREGRSVAELFAEDGESYFRRAEARIGRELLALEDVVLATGGGWATHDGWVDEVPEGTETFWLRVSPAEAVGRVRDQPGQRPLLEGDDPLSAASGVISERESQYRRARWAVDTDGTSVEDVSARILGILAREYPESKAE